MNIFIAVLNLALAFVYLILLINNDRKSFRWVVVVNLIGCVIWAIIRIVLSIANMSLCVF